MATTRHHARIDAAPDDVWRVVSDAGAISTWFPSIEGSNATDGVRRCTLQGAGKLEEEIATSDDDLRRSSTASPRATCPSSTTSEPSMYSTTTGRRWSSTPTDVTPDEVARQMDGVLADGLQGLKAHFER